MAGWANACYRDEDELQGVAACPLQSALPPQCPSPRFTAAEELFGVLRFLGCE
jgi:hypothetical protein